MSKQTIVNRVIAILTKAEDGKVINGRSVLSKALKVSRQRISEMIEQGYFPEKHALTIESITGGRVTASQVKRAYVNRSS